MHSLSNLNSYSAQTVTYSDARAIQIQYEHFDVTNQTVNINEGDTHRVQIGREIFQIIGVTANTCYSVNLAGLSGATLTWNTLPTFTASSLSGNVYTVSNISTKAQWDTIKNPLITAPRDYSGIWYYTANIRIYDGATLVAGNSTQWTNTVNVSNLSEITNPISTSLYSPGNVMVVVNPPQITNLENASTIEQYFLRITSNTPAAFGNLVTAGTLGGGNVWYSGNTSMILTGNKAQVNSHLGTLSFWANPTLDVPFYMDYELTNPVSFLQTNVAQYFVRNTVSAWTPSVYSYYYGSRTNYITNAPILNDNTPGGVGTGPYTITIQPTPTSLVTSLATTGNGIGGSTSFDSGSKTLTLGGNLAQIHSHMANITMVPLFGSNTRFNMTYTAFTLDGDTSSTNQGFYGNTFNTSGNISANVLLPRYYESNLTNTPFVVDTPAWVGPVSGTNTYEIRLTSPVGIWTRGSQIGPVASTYWPAQPLLSFYQPGRTDTWSETRTNQAPYWYYYLGDIGGGNPPQFFPAKNVVENSYLTFSVYINGTLDFVQDIPFIGNVNVTPSGRVGHSYAYAIGDIDTTDPMFRGQVLDAPYASSGAENILYLKCNIAIVGAGGGAGGDTTHSLNLEGGGAGGDVLEIRNIQIDTSSSNVSSVWSGVTGYGGQGGDRFGSMNGQQGATTIVRLNGITYSANGGGGGFGNAASPTLGFGGNNTSHIGGLIRGGGGAGAGTSANLGNVGIGKFTTIANTQLVWSALQMGYLGGGGAGNVNPSGNIIYGGGGNATVVPTTYFGGGGSNQGAAGGAGGIWIEWYRG